MQDIRNPRILVTGACGVTSRAVVRSLKMSAAFGNARFIGTDVCENLYGVAEGLYDTLYRVPHVKESSYAEIMDRICRNEHADLAIVIPELEVLHWTRNKMRVPCLLPPPYFCEIAGSKAVLYQALQASSLVPAFELATREALAGRGYRPSMGWPCWVRDYGVGSTSGRGSFCAGNNEELRAWIVLNQGIERFMVSEFLPGRNFACHLLYYRGELISTGIYERLGYFMGRIAPSGVSGNIAKGRLLNEPRVLAVSRAAVEEVCKRTREVMQGIVTVDLRENALAVPMVTEINLRHVACTSAFAAAGHNLAEAQAFATLDMPSRVGERDGSYPLNNYILRDIDGPALWVRALGLPPVGHAVTRVR